MILVSNIRSCASRLCKTSISSAGRLIFLACNPSAEWSQSDQGTMWNMRDILQSKLAAILMKAMVWDPPVWRLSMKAIGLRPHLSLLVHKWHMRGSDLSAMKPTMCLQAEPSALIDPLHLASKTWSPVWVKYNQMTPFPSLVMLQHPLSSNATILSSFPAAG